MRSNIDELKQAFHDGSLTNDEFLFLHLLRNIEQTYGLDQVQQTTIHSASSLRMFTITRFVQGSEPPKCIVIMDNVTSRNDKNDLLFLVCDVGMMARLARDFGEAAVALLEEVDDWQHDTNKT